MSQPAKPTLGIGIIGMGWMGQVHSRAYLNVLQRFPEVGIQPRLLICSDNVAERATQAKQVLGFEQSTTNWQDVISHPDVDIVNVTAPNNLHVEIVKAATAAGKHVVCEKPVGRTPAETAEIEALARNAGVMSFVGFNYRWAPMIQYAKQLLAQGKLGELTQFKGRFFSMYGSNPYGLLNWRFDKEISGYGVLGDIMSHTVDMALMLVGPIARLVSNQHTFIKERPLPIPGKGTHFSVGRPGDPTQAVSNEDYVGALVEFDNGVRGSLEVSRTIFGPKTDFAFELYGTKGSLAWNFERMNELQLYLPTEDDHHDGYMRIVAGEKHPFHNRFNPGDGSGIGYEDLKIIEAYHCMKAIASGQPSQPNLTDALAVANVHAAMIRSWDSGHWEDVTSIRVN